MKKQVSRLLFSVIIIAIIASVIVSVGCKKHRVNTDDLVKATVSLFGGIDVRNSKIVDDVSVGTGFFFDDGLIMTANHNVTSQCVVMTYDGKIFDTEVLYSDTVNDIAILQIEAEGYPFLKISDDEIGIDENILCVCTPKTIFLKNTVLSGKITNINVNGLANQYLLQTDLPLSPGCSGSPLINEDGDVIAMNAFKSTEFATEGLSFAIYGDKLINSIKVFKKNAKPIELDLTFSENLNNQYGVFLSSGITVIDVGDASILNGQILANDVICYVDEKEIFTKADFYENFRVGSSISIVRGGKSIKITVLEAS
ncbi:MAG: serine protease [Clostridia bacterium]|nr:serine protease [Clostridia bacterium]